MCLRLPLCGCSALRITRYDLRGNSHKIDVEFRKSRLICQLLLISFPMEWATRNGKTRRLRGEWAGHLAEAVNWLSSSPAGSGILAPCLCRVSSASSVFCLKLLEAVPATISSHLARGRVKLIR